MIPQFEDPFHKAETKDLDPVMCDLCGKFTDKSKMVIISCKVVCRDCFDAEED